MNESRAVFTYEDEKVKTVTAYFFDALGASPSVSQMQVKFTWSGDIVSKCEAEMDLYYILQNMTEFDDISFEAGIGEVKIAMEVVATIEEGQLKEEIVREKILGNPELIVPISDLLQEYALPIDTAWTVTSKSEVTHGSGYDIYTTYTYEPEADEWTLSTKDSLVLDERGNIIKDFFYYQSFFGDELVLSTRDSMVYDSEGILLEVVSSYKGFDDWLNTERFVYVYEEYQGASVKHLSNRGSNVRLDAEIRMVNNIPVVNFKNVKTSKVDIQLYTVQGKRIGNTITNTCAAGPHSVKLSGVSSGNYICRIVTDHSSTSLPFKLMR